MPRVVSILLTSIAIWFRSRLALQMEFIALRHQVAVYKESIARPKLQSADRLLWVWLSRLWLGWQQMLKFVQPRTVIAWQKKRFRDYWRRLSQSGRPGRPAMSKEVIDLIRDMWRANPTAQWTAQQIVEAFPWDTAPRYLLRDRNAIYGAAFQSRVKNMAIKEVKIAPRSPWQNPYCERLIGSIRRDALSIMSSC